MFMTCVGGARRGRQETLAQGLAPDQHPEAHLISVGERDLGVHVVPDQAHSHRHHDAVLGVPRRAAHGAPVVHPRLVHDGVGGAVLPGAYREAHPLLAVAVELVDVERVQRRRARPGVDLRLEPLDPQLRQPDPLAPTRGRV